MATANKTPVLSVEHVTMRFGGLTAVSDLSFEANRNEITALIGPNGAGKTTVFNCITGFYKPTEGKIALRHADGTEFLLERMDDFRIAQNAKVARTFQNIRLFSGMTVLENLMVAQHNKLMVASGYTVAGVLGSGHYRRAEKDAIELAKAWLEKVRLIDRADDPAGDLPYGDQRRLEIARAMCTEPRLLCLDEPSLGLAPLVVQEIFRTIRQVNQDGTSILLVEQNARYALETAQRGYVIQTGSIVAAGACAILREDPRVKEAYLGRGVHA